MEKREGRKVDAMYRLWFRKTWTVNVVFGGKGLNIGVLGGPREKAQV